MWIGGKMNDKCLSLTEPCTYIVRNSTCSVSVENTTTVSSKGCVDLCTQRNLSNGQCVSCSFNSSSSTCTLHASNSSVTTLAAGTPCDLYCWSCVHGKYCPLDVCKWPPSWPVAFTIRMMYKWAKYYNQEYLKDFIIFLFSKWFFSRAPTLRTCLQMRR